MKALITSIAITILTIGTAFVGTAQAADEFLGPWASGDKEILNITKDGDKLNAEFIRENVKFEYEKVQFPAIVKDGTLVISGSSLKRNNRLFNWLPLTLSGSTLLSALLLSTLRY